MSRDERRPGRLMWSFLSPLKYGLLGFITPYVLALVGWYVAVRDWSQIPIASIPVAVTVCFLIPVGVFSVFALTAVWFHGLDQR